MDSLEYSPTPGKKPAIPEKWPEHEISGFNHRLRPDECEDHSDNESRVYQTTHRDPDQPNV